MFIPLSAKQLVARLVVMGQSDPVISQGKWTNAHVWYLAKHPKYTEIRIQKRAADRNILVGDGTCTPKVRIIHAPCYRLKRIQSYILSMVLEPAIDTLKGCAHGCVPGRSTVTNAAPHVGARFKIHMDLKDFFPSISVRRVYGLFHGAFKYGIQLSWLLANLCCHDGKLPQGAPTSPMIANMIATPMDWHLCRLLAAMHGYYTRYVDDLTFSFHRWMPREARDRFIRTVAEIVERNGFKVNSDKTGVASRKHRMSVTGIVINDKLSVPREFRANLRAAIHNRSRGIATEDTVDVIGGKLSYVNMVSPGQAKSVSGHAAER